VHQNRVGSTFPERGLHVPELDRVVPGSRGHKAAVGAQRQPLEGFGLGKDGLTEGLSLVAPFRRFLDQKDDFIHRLSHYIK